MERDVPSSFPRPSHTFRAVAVFVAALPAPALALRKATTRCSGGTFVARQVAASSTDFAGPMVLDLSRAGGLHVPGGGHGCMRPPDAVHFEARRRFTKVSARWKECDALRGPVRFRGRISGARCDLLEGTLVMRRTRPRSMRLRGQLVCPLDAGRYTLMPSGLAFLDVPEAVSGALDLQPIVFEAAAGDADCRHDVVVPFPGGFGRGIGCLAGVTFSFEQGGCGVGIIDSDGGSDFTVKENADTSDRSAVCSLSQPGCEQYRNRSLRNDVTVGDGVTDACAPPGTANMIVSIPLIATVWQDAGGCPAPDMTFDPGTDALVARVVQIANLTTSTATVEFVDLDGDHCIHDLGLSFGPSSASGTCFDLGGRSVSLAAAAPGNDATLGDFISTLFAPFTVSGASAPTGATCATPPPTPVDGGTAPRCIVPPECGDGVVGAGETCDGANDGACPGHCRADCLCAGCMNDVAEVGEECDWSDDAACPGRCLSDCTCGP